MLSGIFFNCNTYFVKYIFNNRNVFKYTFFFLVMKIPREQFEKFIDEKMKQEGETSLIDELGVDGKKCMLMVFDLDQINYPLVSDVVKHIQKSDLTETEKILVAFKYGSGRDGLRLMHELFEKLKQMGEQNDDEI